LFQTFPQSFEKRALLAHDCLSAVNKALRGHCSCGQEDSRQLALVADLGIICVMLVLKNARVMGHGDFYQSFKEKLWVAGSV
jgi:hypothetical protein